MKTTSVKRLHLARDYIIEHYNQPVTLTDLVRVSRLSRSYLIRSFRKLTGMAPHEFLLHTRIRHAREQICRGLSMLEIAQDTGFADQSHFTRCFKAIVGITPGRYRRRETAEHTEFTEKINCIEL